VGGLDRLSDRERLSSPAFPVAATVALALAGVMVAVVVPVSVVVPSLALLGLLATPHGAVEVDGIFSVAYDPDWPSPATGAGNSPP
jgi:hypothetical protein